jgi:serine/threonine protein kinase
MEHFGHYLVNDPENDKLGEGRFGIVYKALDTRTKRRVALKVIKSSSKTDVARFAREAHALATMTIRMSQESTMPRKITSSWNLSMAGR